MKTHRDQPTAAAVAKARTLEATRSRERATAYSAFSLAYSHYLYCLSQEAKLQGAIAIYLAVYEGRAYSNYHPAPAWMKQSRHQQAR